MYIIILEYMSQSKTSYSRLQLSQIKVAQEDRAFFDNILHNHPPDDI
jgi:hypothetical protein